MGSSLKAVTVNRGMFHGKHQVVRVLETPENGSMLEQLGMKKDNVISRVNGTRVKSATQLTNALNSLRNKRVSVEYRESSDTEFKTVHSHLS